MKRILIGIYLVGALIALIGALLLKVWLFMIGLTLMCFLLFLLRDIEPPINRIPG